MQPEQQQQQQQFQSAGYQTASGFTLHPNMLVQQFIMQQQQQHNMNQATAVIHSSTGSSHQPIYLYQSGQSIYQQNLVPVQTVLSGGATSATIDLSRANIVNNNSTSSASKSNGNMLDKLNESNSSTEEHNAASNLSGDRLYKCSQCFKTFRKKVHLNQHCRIHSGERPYGCDYCEKRFTQLSHLWQHTRRHTGERPYKCDVGTCDKSFTQLSNLQSHLRTHGITTTDTPNTTASSQQQQLIQGLNPAAAVLAVAAAAANLTNPSLQLKCSKCNKSFASRDELLAHMATRHGDLSMTLATSSSTPTTTSNTTKSSRGNSGSGGSANKRHYCEICRKRFATEGVIRSHVCSRQPNAALVRNAEGSLIIKAFNPP